MIFVVLGQFRQVLEFLLMLCCQRPFLKSFGMVLESKLLAEADHAIVKIDFGNPSERVIDSVNPIFVSSDSILNNQGW